MPGSLHAWYGLRDLESLAERQAALEGELEHRRLARLAESLHPADYYSSSYYQIWIKALETLLKRHGFVTERDLAAGKAVDAAATPKRVLKAADVPAVLAKGGPCDRPVATPARFRAGDRVRTKNFNPTGHTRLPRYARGKNGTFQDICPT